METGPSSSDNRLTKKYFLQLAAGFHSYSLLTSCQILVVYK